MLIRSILRQREPRLIHTILFCVVFVPASIYLVETMAQGTHPTPWLKWMIGISLGVLMVATFRWPDYNHPFIQALLHLNTILMGGLMIVSLAANQSNPVYYLQAILLLSTITLLIRNRQLLVGYLVLYNVGLWVAGLMCQCGPVPYLYLLLVLMYSLIAYVHFGSLSQTRQRLQTQLRLLAEAQKAAQMGAWTSRSGSRVFDLSPEAAMVLGFGAQPMALPFEQLIAMLHPSDWPKLAVFQEVGNLSLSDVVDDYYRITPHQGAEKHIRSINRIAINTEGEKYFYGLFQDVTAQQVAMAQLRQSETELRAILESSSETVILVDQLYTIVALNQRAKSFDPFNANRTKQVGECILSYVPPGNLASYFEQDMQRAFKGERVSGETHLKLPNGGEMWLAVGYTPVTNPTGPIDRVVFTIRNITADKQAEQLLHASEVNLRAILDHASQGIMLVDASCRILALNSLAENGGPMFPGLAVRAGDNAADRMPEPYFAAFQVNLTQALAGEIVQVEHQMDSPEQGTQWFAVMYTPVLEAGVPTDRVVVSVQDVTQAKLGKQQLMESEANLRTILDISPQAILLMDEHYQILMMNQRGQVMGESYLADAGHFDNTFVSFVPLANRPTLEQNIQRVLAGEEVSLEYERILPDRESIWYAISYVPVREHGQLINRIVVTIGDISAQKVVQKKLQEVFKSLSIREKQIRTLLDQYQIYNAQLAASEKELKQSELQLKILADNTSEMIALSTPVGNILYLSPASEKLTGYAREEMYGKSLVEFFHPDDLDRLQVESQTNLEGQRLDLVLTHRFLTKGGRYIWLESIIKYISDNEGNVINLQSSSRSVEDRLQAERALRSSEQSYRALFNSNSYAVFVYRESETKNAQVKFQEVNQAACLLLGYSREELLGLGPVDLELPSMKALRKGDRGNGPETQSRLLETVLMHKAGHEIPVEISWSFVENEESKGVQSIVTDIRERKRAIKNEQQKELAERALQFKTDFLANMSHEIRTPMNGIIGILHFLLDTQLDEKQRNYAAMIQSSAKNLLHILNDILELSKIEAGKLALKPKVIELHRVIHTVKGLFGSLAAQKGLSLISQYSPGVPKLLLADENRLQQVLTNLVSNAIKFTPSGKVTIRIQTQPSSQPGGPAWLKIGVEDTGEGISGEAQLQLFEKFYQVASENNQKSVGTGLGLSICKQLVALWGGEMNVASELGKGSTFWFTLPIVELSPDQVDQLALPEPQVIMDYQVSNLRILLAEDVFVNQEVVRIMFENAGTQIDIASNGREALAMMRQQSYALVILDIQMPILDGLATTRLIRQEFDPAPVIIGLSANAMEGDATRYTQQGMDDYLAKPIEPPAMFTKLAHWFPSHVVAVPRPAAQLAAPPPADKVLLNLTTIDKIKGLAKGNQSLMDKLFASFINDVEVLLGKIDEALGQQDTQNVKSALHTLKGLAGTIGAARLSELAKAMEQCIEQADLTELPAQLDSLQTVFGATKAALRDL